MSSSYPWHLFTGELINLAMYCERIRRKFWPEWFVDLEDFCYDSDNDTTTSGTPTCLLDLGLFSRTDTLEESELSSPSHADTHSQDTPQSRRSLSDSDIEVDVDMLNSDVEQQIKG